MESSVGEPFASKEESIESAASPSSGKKSTAIKIKKETDWYQTPVLETGSGKIPVYLGRKDHR